MSTPVLKHVLEAALFAAGRPLSLEEMLGLFVEGDLEPDRAALREALAELVEDWNGRGVELVEVAGGHRFQVRREFGAWMAPLWAERPPRYSRALLETLALIAYRQPITRAEIEEVRGVSVSSSIIKTLMERDWIRVLGHREVPGRPALYGTTPEFLDSFGLKQLEDLPQLSELSDLDQAHDDLFSGLVGADGVSERGASAGDAGAGQDVGDEGASGPVEIAAIDVAEPETSSESAAAGPAPGAVAERLDPGTADAPDERAADAEVDRATDDQDEHPAAAAPSDDQGARSEAVDATHDQRAGSAAAEEARDEDAVPDTVGESDDGGPDAEDAGPADEHGGTAGRSGPGT